MKMFLPMIFMLLTIQEQGFTVWSQDIEQNRPVMRIDERLMNAANFKAQLMAKTGIIAHCVDDYCPNKMVREFGCKTEYGDDGNQVESLAVGFSNVTNAYEALRESPLHRPHILGIDFFESQDEVGVGYYEYENNYYYVFISANCLE